MADISVKIDSRDLQKKLGAVQEGAKSLKKPLEKAGKELEKYYAKEIFRTQGAKLGKRWQPLSAATLKMREKRTGYYRQPAKQQGSALIWTGRLQKGFSSKAGRVKLVVKNTVSYFKHHQSPKGANPPQRQILGINKDVIKIVEKQLVKFFANKIKK